MRFLPKIIAVSLFVLSSFLFANPTLAYPGSSLDQWQGAINDQKFNQQSWGDQTMQNGMLSITRQIFGGVTPEAIKTSNGGAVGMLAGGIATMYDNPPASGITYFADMGKKLNLIKPAYAQTGFERLSGEGILGIWRGFRNVSYILFVLVFVALGFAIMLRMNLSPQTVITIQSALPRLILALILVTFSYAIAGLMIDLSFVSTSIIDRVVDTITPPDILTQLKNITFNLTGGIGTSAILSIIGGFAGAIAAGAGVIWTIPIIGTAVPLIAAGAVIGATLIMIVTAILFLFAILRVLWILLKAYIGLIFKIIFAPIIIVFNTLPGRSVFWGWFGSFFADLIVFPVVYALLLIGWVLVRTIGPSGNPFVPVPTVVAPFFGLLQGFLGIAILLLIPNVVEVVKESIHKSTPLGGPTGIDTTRELTLYRAYKAAATAAPGSFQANALYGLYGLFGGKRT